MDRAELRSGRRTIEGKQVKKLRANGLVPAVMFGPETPSVSIQVAERALAKTLSHAGSALINLFIDDEPQPHAVLVRGVQRHSITGRLQHVDFYQVNLTERIRTTIPLVFVGESPVVAGEDAALNRRIEELEVECLAEDLVDHIAVDVSALRDFDDVIRVGDLHISDKITVLEPAEEVVVSIQMVRPEVEAPAVAAEEEEEEEEEG